MQNSKEVFTDDEIIREEIDGIMSDIIELYESSGKKVSGEFAKGLETVYEPNKGTLLGFTYLAGRGKTKKGNKGGKYLIEKILDWIETKGIKPREKSVSIKSLAWMITQKIHREGTNPENFMKIYEEVITPERINNIIERISKLNVNRLVTQVRSQLDVLAKNV